MDFVADLRHQDLIGLSVADVRRQVSFSGRLFEDGHRNVFQYVASSSTLLSKSSRICDIGEHFQGELADAKSLSLPNKSYFQLAFCLKNLFEGLKRQ